MEGNYSAPMHFSQQLQQWQQKQQLRETEQSAQGGV